MSLPGSMGQIAEVIQSPLFARQKKKLKEKEQRGLDEAVRAIMADPAVGSTKCGDLQGVRVYKYRSGTSQMLLAYELADNGTTLHLYAVGRHENFYRDLSKYIHQ